MKRPEIKPSGKMKVYINYLEAEIKKLRARIVSMETGTIADGDERFTTPSGRTVPRPIRKIPIAQMEKEKADRESAKHPSGATAPPGHIDNPGLVHPEPPDKKPETPAGEYAGPDDTSGVLS